MSERRTLLVAERVVPPADRERYVAALRDTQARCEAVGVHFWAFEHERDHSRYLEFAEAKDASRLNTLGLDSASTSRWHSVELG
jgi:hypothetical protein